MQEFGAHLFQKAIESLDSILRILEVNYQVYQDAGRLDVKHRDEYQEATDALLLAADHLKKCGFLVSAATTEELLLELRHTYDSAPNEFVVFHGLQTRIEEIHRSIRSESKLHLFMYLAPERVRFFSDPTQGWEDVAKRWPEVAYDIKESSVCFALDRYAASTFHILQVAEFGVIKICDLMCVSGDKPGWGCVKRLRAIVDKPFKDCCPLEQQHRKFLTDLVPLMEIVMKSWRHKLDHVDNWLKWLNTDFGPENAEEVRTATRGFMRNLSRELP
jgi:hypothetical protein